MNKKNIYELVLMTDEIEQDKTYGDCPVISWGNKYYYLLSAKEPDQWVSVDKGLPKPYKKIQFETNHIQSPDNLYYGVFNDRSLFCHAYHAYRIEDVIQWKYADIPPTPPKDNKELDKEELLEKDKEECTCGLAYEFCVGDMCYFKNLNESDKK